MIGRFLALALCLAPVAVQARPALVPERLVMLYRHGVRAPLETEAALDGLAHPPLPAWPVAASLLTPMANRRCVIRRGSRQRHGAP
jgi:4-phytase/acid phosphatase